MFAPTETLSCPLPDAPKSRKKPEACEVLLERILSDPQLPSPPTLALQIVEKVSKTDCEIGEISDLLALDPAICGKLLKAINSALFGLSRPVTSLKRAVALLGLKPLRSMVLTLSLPAMQFRLEADQGLRNYWKRSVAGAILARELARRLNHPAPEDDLLASLLRDLGMILLRQFFPEVYQPIWTGAGELLGDQQCFWEEEHLGIDHAETSAALLHRWHLPSEIVEPVRYHHHTHGLPSLSQLLVQRTHLLAFSSSLAQLSDIPPAPGFLKEILRTGRDHFAMEQGDLENFLTEVRPTIEEFAAVLQVDIGTCPHFAQVLATGCEELVRLSMETAQGQIESASSRAKGLAAIADEPDSLKTSLSARGCALPNTGSFHTAETMEEGGPIPVFSPEFFDSLAQPGRRCRIQHYEIEKLIGQGAMGIVLKAYDPLLNRPVALKVLTPERAIHSEARQRFAREARIAAAIRHDNVVSIFTVSEVNRLPFLVMEYVPGLSLQDRLQSGEKFCFPEIARIGQQTALGLAAAHRQRLIHRDIKPANLLLEDDPLRVRITDFGLARALDDDTHLSQEGQVLGTPLYMSPEQVRGEKLDPLTDLFSLGSVLYTLCTGQPPFPGDSLMAVLHAVSEKIPTPIRILNPALPEWLARIIDKLHAKNPADRFPSAAALAEVLEWNLKTTPGCSC